MKTLVLGMGNPILADDGAGICVARRLKQRLDGDVTITEASVGGLNLIELLAGYDRAILIDAIQTRGGTAGEVHRLAPEDFNSTRHATNPHDLNFATALELGKRLGMSLPEEIVIFAIEVADVTSFSERCTPAVARAIPRAAAMVLAELGIKGQGNC